MANPSVIVISGPNGAGKSTCASKYLLAGMTFVNADEVAKTLPDYPSLAADMQAGRLVLSQMDDLEMRRYGFCVETTLATRSLAPRIERLRKSGYRFHLIYVWSPSADFSIRRVALRVKAGGHHIPEETIKRRYLAGLRNFFQLYQPMADTWDVLDNSSPNGPRLIACGRVGNKAEIHDSDLWNLIRQRGTDGTV